MRSRGSSDFFALSPTSLGGISTHAKEVVETAVALDASFSLPLPLLLPTDLR